MTEERSSESSNAIEIVDTVYRERFARDDADWETLAAQYIADSLVDLSWFKGTGAEFVERSKELYRNNVIGMHSLGAIITKQLGHRAIARVSCTIGFLSPVLVGGVEVEMAASTRLHYRLIRGADGWKIGALTCIYLKDAINAVFPGETVPIDKPALERGRRSYRFLSYIMRERGIDISDDLPGVDRPETIHPVLEADNAWLAAG